MSSVLFPQNLTSTSFSYDNLPIKEETEKKEKIKTCLTWVDNLVEDISHKIADHKGISELLDDEEISNILINMVLREVRTITLGTYYSKDKSICYFGELSITDPTLFEVVKIHERFHAIHHLALENGMIWYEFTNTPSFYKELLAQLFTFKVLENKSDLRKSFLALNEGQSGEYRTWELFRYFSEKQCEELYWEIRRRINNNLSLGWLNTLSGLLSGKNINSIVASSLKTTINRFREKPFYYFTEADIHSALAADLMNGNSDLLSTRINGYAISLIHQEYPCA